MITSRQHENICTRIRLLLLDGLCIKTWDGGTVSYCLNENTIIVDYNGVRKAITHQSYSPGTTFSEALRNFMWFLSLY